MLQQFFTCTPFGFGDSSSMHFHEDRACYSSFLHARHLGSEIREIETRENFVFSVLESICEILSPRKCQCIP